MKRLGMLQHLSMVALVAAGFAGCGDDDDPTPTFDARPAIDAPITFDAIVPDAAPAFDARPPDAPSADAGPTFSGTMAIHDIELFGVPNAGHGNQIDIVFSQNGIPTVASASIAGIVPCSASVRDVTVAAQNNPALNEGTVTFTRTPAGGSAAALPACNFVGAAGTGSYRCLTGMGASGTIAQSANANVGTFSNSTHTFTAADVGAYLIITSGDGAGNAWPIVGVSGMTAGLQRTSVAAFPATVGTFIVQHGVGPIAITADPDGSNATTSPPEFLADDDSFTVALTPGGGSHFAAFTSAAFGAGNKFTLDTDSTTVFTTGLNLNSTTPIMLGCDSTACPQNSALVTVVNIQTTDTPGGGPTELLPPTQFSGSLTCASLDTRVSIDASLLAVLRMGNPRKIRLSVFRDGGDLGALASRLSVVAGHGIVVFQDIAAP